ncbi:MAG: hypothetical protein CME68_06120 [Halobacteriovoraceae bacterium]|nr:hypothetical protein [Halobacteriovoraceae bacterium]
MRILIGTLVFSFLVYAFIFVNKAEVDLNTEELGEVLEKENKESKNLNSESLEYAFEKINKKIEKDKEKKSEKKKIEKASTSKEDQFEGKLKEKAFVGMVAKKAIEGFERAMSGEEVSAEEMDLLKQAFNELDDPKKQVNMAKKILRDLPTETKLPMRALFWTLAGEVIKDRAFVREEVYPDLIATLNSDPSEEDPEGIMTTSMIFHIYVGKDPSQDVFDKSIEIIKLQKSDQAKKMLFSRLLLTYGDKLEGKTYKDF